jgi:acetolactate synthase I/II/III large subunit
MATTMSEDTVYRSLAGCFSEAGVRRFFGVVGDDTIPFMTELKNMGTRYTPARHEAVAVGMADGYSWASGSIGLAVLTRGPGLVNGLTAAHAAVGGKRGVVIVAGDAPIGADRYCDYKYIDPGPVIDSAGLVHFAVARPGGEVAAVRGALTAAAAGRPAVISVPANILNGPAGGASSWSSGTVRDSSGTVWDEATQKEEPSPGILAHDDDIERIAELLSTAARPLIVVGRGAANDVCRAHVIELAERSGALIGTTLLARDLFRGHRLNLGIVGGWASDPATPVLAEVDTVLAVGASLNTYTTAEHSLFKGATIVQVDADPAALGMHCRVDLPVLGDATDVVKRVLAALPEGKDGPFPQHDSELLASLTQPPYAGSDESVADELDPRPLALRIGQLLPRDCAVVLDSGRFMSWPGRFVSTSGPAWFRNTCDFGAISAGLAIALGAALGRPDTPTALFIGDGGLSMVLGDLDTAAALDARLLIFVFNDCSYGAERYHQERRGLPTELADLRSIEFAEVARILGMDAATVRTMDDLEGLADRIGVPSAPMLIDCKVRRELRLERYVSWK